ncbi:MAG: T9SS type A sorting domain-containing protein [Saprospiraceae bacterium]|nr:T9SS type A sorting domain-containing protein [Saprospiraceae bacterium]
MNTYLQGATAMRSVLTSRLSWNSRHLFHFFHAALPVLALVLAGSSLMAQAAVNDYRTAGINGNWNNLATWERFNGTTWVTPTAGQGTPNNTDGIITILNTDTITVTANVNVDQVLIEAGAMVTINSGVTFRVYNSADAVDMTVNGTIDNSGTVNRNGTPRVEVNGTVINRNAFTLTGAGTILNFNAGSTYQHNRNGGTVSIATSWNDLATCEVVGVITTIPSGLNQAFGNFIWNCPLQTAILNLPNTGMSVSGNMEIISTGVLPLLGGLRAPNSPLTIGGNFTLTDGFFRLSNGDIDRSIVIGGSVTIAGGELQMAQGGGGADGIGTLQIAGDFTHIGGLITDAATGPGDGVIEFNGSGTPQLFSATEILSGEINFQVTSPAFLQMEDEFTVITGDGDFTLQAGASLGITAADGITLSDPSGNIQVMGLRTFDPDAIYHYNGLLLAQMTGDGLPTSASDLVINNPNGVTLTQSVLINGTITFTVGLLATTATEFLMVNAGATVSGASSVSFVDGPMEKTGDEAFIFPVGDGGVFAPIGISASNDAMSNTFRAEYFLGDPSVDIGPDLETGIVEAISSLGYWDLSKVAGVMGSAVEVTLFWVGNMDAVMADVDALLVTRFDGSMWTTEGGAPSGDPTVGGEVTSGFVSDFSFFALGSSIAVNALPIELLAFTATLNGTAVELKWSTASELDNAFFDIERSANGRDFARIGKVAGAGTSQVQLNYAFTDERPLTGQSYYRLRQEDTNGDFSYSPVRVVQINKSSADLRVFPNPVSNELNLIANRLIEPGDRFEIVDYTGRRVMHLSAAEAANAPVNLSALPAGTYVARLHTASGTVSTPFVKQ